jgi:hypothetical protein
MQLEMKERWQELCAQAAKEQDPGKLLALTQEINRLLEEKEDRMKAARQSEIPKA